MTHFMKVYFHTCQSLFTAYFSKNNFVKNAFFIKLSVTACFPTFFKHIQEKTDLLFYFWFRDSRVIIVTFLSSLESADSECLTYTRINTLSCLYNIYQHKKSNYVKKIHGHHMLSLSLPLFKLNLYILVNIFSVMLGRVFPSQT